MTFIETSKVKFIEKASIGETNNGFEFEEQNEGNSIQNAEITNMNIDHAPITLIASNSLP